MTSQKRPAPYIALAFAGLAAVALTGCLADADQEGIRSDGQSSFLTSEVDHMGEVLNTGSSEAAPTLGGIDTGSIVGELVIDPLKYQADCQCFVRRAKFTGQNGFERIRLDSIWLLDDTGAKLDKFNLAAVAKVIHKRHVMKSRDANDVDVHIDTEMELKTLNGDKVGVWNGTMTGTYNGDAFKSGTITNVTREFKDGRFHFPQSGSIEVVRPVFKFLVEFQGDGRAKVTITNQKTGRIRILWVDRNHREA